MYYHQKKKIICKVYKVFCFGSTVRTGSRTELNCENRFYRFRFWFQFSSAGDPSPNLKLPDRSSPSFNFKSNFLESITSSWGGGLDAGYQRSGGGWRHGVDTNQECGRSEDYMCRRWCNESLKRSCIVFDVIGELFKTVKVASQNIFNWLAYLFAWDDIKATAVRFRNIFDAQIGNAQGYMDRTARTQLKNFIGNAKIWLKDNMDTVLTNSENLTVGEYNKAPTHQTICRLLRPDYQTRSSAVSWFFFLIYWKRLLTHWWMFWYKTPKIPKDIDTPIDIPLISKIFKDIIGLDLTLLAVTSTAAVFFDNTSRTLIPFAYGIAIIFSGFWHMVNIADGTETGSKKDWGVVFAEVTAGVPGAAKIIKFSRNPQFKSILVAVDTLPYGAATIAYISAAGASTRFNRRRERGVHTFEARPTIDYHTILMMTSNQPSRMLEVGWFPLAVSQGF
ncbi:hypothetical protein BYT27DRAFT_7240965 [Phlegmacium glaucopus]|nr:hypothetical protein BYT27DRAFT_7240965 [Phlegmacium glaucopus]